MALFRPSNLNKRVVSATGGNGGVIGTTQRPYANGPLNLGCRCCGGCCTGRFSISESFCGVKECCGCPVTDCGGFFICCGPSTTKWFVAPSCTQLERTWHSRADAVTVANSCMGSCGWFYPNCSHFCNPLWPCRSFWDYRCGRPIPTYWTDTEQSAGSGFYSNLGSNEGVLVSESNKAYCNQVRAIRCTAT